MTIDNFDIIKKHLDFKSPLDRYIVHILRRPKDCEELSNQLGSNEAQRLIRTYYIDSLEYFERKIPAMKELCHSCNARAYIIPQVKDNFECLLNLGKKIFDTIQNKNYSVKPEHLIRQAYCEYHKSRKKVWILDLDDEDDMYVVPTKHGHHIITSPFNLQAAYKECDMMFEGVKKCIRQDFGKIVGKGTDGYEQRTGWLHKKDGMTLLYYHKD